MSSDDTKIKRKLLESDLGLLEKEYEKNPWRVGLYER